MHLEKANPQIDTTARQSDYAQNSPLMFPVKPSIQGRLSLSTPRITVCEENRNSPDRSRVPQVRSQLLLHEDSQSDSSSQRSNHAYTDLPTPHDSSVKLEVKSKKKYRWVKRKKRKQDWNSSISICEIDYSIR